MGKLWEGRTSGETNYLCDILNKSIDIDKRFYKEDIEGSIAHVKMLAKQKIIKSSDASKIEKALNTLIKSIEQGKVVIDTNYEDIHSFVEAYLTEKIGDIGKKVHTARSRNDQVALDIRLFLKKDVKEKIDLLKKFIEVLLKKAKENTTTLMPGYTHMQRAQAIYYAQDLLCYSQMFLRDIDRLKDCIKRIDVSPIGSGALSGTTFDVDRFYEAKQLGLSSVCLNSMDGVSDRDFIIELISCMSIIMMHLSRFSEELILFQSMEFSFIDLSDNYTTGSSMMPQKKNPDMAELVRGKTGRVYGDLITILTIMKALPLAYNKDMQEDKECVFDAIDTVDICLKVYIGMIATMQVKPTNMRNAVKKGFLNATDVADYLAKKGMPFRDAYKISGKLVRYCIEQNTTLEDLDINKYKEYSNLFENDLYKYIDNENIANAKNSFGGTSQKSIKDQIVAVQKLLAKKGRRI